MPINTINPLFVLCFRKIFYLIVWINLDAAITYVYVVYVQDLEIKEFSKAGGILWL